MSTKDLDCPTCGAPMHWKYLKAPVCPGCNSEAQKSKPWAVFERAGYNNERLVSTWATYDDAWCAMQELYTPEERDELHIDVMRWDNEQGAWTTEY